jgi:hypothetical protein
MGDNAYTVWLEEIRGIARFDTCRRTGEDNYKMGVSEMSLEDTNRNGSEHGLIADFFDVWNEPS